MAGADYYAPANHEAASKFLIQETVSANYSPAVAGRATIDFSWPIQLDRRTRMLRAKPMKKFLLALLLIASPAWAQTKLTPKAATARVDNCAPIGQTADRTLVYSMK